MFRSNKDTERINLIEVDAAAGRTNAGASFAMAVLGSIVISAAVVGAVWLFGNIQENNYKAETAEIQEYLDSPEVAAQIAAVDAAQKKLDKVNTVKKVVDTAYTNFNSLPKLTTEVIATIEENFEGTGAEWRSLSFGNGAMSLSAVARTHDEPSQVVENFFTQDVFKNVSYTGFSMSDEDGVVTYKFSISFDMPEVEEETEEAAEETAATN